MSRFLIFVATVVFFSCSQKSTQLFEPDDMQIHYSGRIDLDNKKEPVLIGSASFVELAFSGDSCEVLLKKLNPDGEHNYVSFELDGKYLGRVRLENKTYKSFPIEVPPGEEEHLLRIFKPTEAQNGNIAFGGVKVMKLNSPPLRPSKSIEFIGNSITCGMGVAWKEIPCDSGVWYDQHEAYWAYGPRVARELEVNFMLSSVSGIGIYRNWNGPGPVMPAVYENMYLQPEGNEWDFSRFSPDLVSIALGTNDFSDGDGINERLPFDSAQFVSSYIRFVNTVYDKYPDAQICLLTSPMVSGEKGETFYNCLLAVKQHFGDDESLKKEIAVYDFSSVEPHGCSYHPDKDDQEKMADQLIPFYKEVMGW